MSELIVFAFPTETGASEMDETIHQLKKEELMFLKDAAVVIRKPDGKIKVKQATNLVGVGALGGAFWGMLIGLFFWMPWLGLALGAVVGAISGKLSDYGINDDFINEVGATIQPGGSALFLLISKWTEDKALERLKKFNSTVVRHPFPKKRKKNLKLLSVQVSN
jgi:uncharacterized membrane protein